MKKILLTLALIIGSFSGLFLFNLGLAAALDCSNTDNLTAKQQLQCGACGAAGTTNCDPSNAPGTLSDTITTFVNLLSILVGIVAVIMIIIGGFRYITSGGKQESVTAAKNTILYAVIGLIIVALAQIIVKFVLHSTTNASSG